MDALTVATDEDLALKASGDWPLIAPPYQRMAEGGDGVFGVDRWTLSSATNDFEAQGLTTGYLLILPKEIDEVDRTSDILGIVSATGQDLVLRRIGMAAGLGRPAGPVGGGDNVPFVCLTAAPQIARKTYEIQRQFNIQTSEDLSDSEDIRRAVVLMVLIELYESAAISMIPEKDALASKAKQLKDELKCALDTLDDLYGLDGSGNTAVSGDLNTPVDFPVFPYC